MLNIFSSIKKLLLLFLIILQPSVANVMVMKPQGLNTNVTTQKTPVVLDVKKIQKSNDLIRAYQKGALFFLMEFIKQNKMYFFLSAFCYQGFTSSLIFWYFQKNISAFVKSAQSGLAKNPHNLNLVIRNIIEENKFAVFFLISLVILFLAKSITKIFLQRYIAKNNDFYNALYFAYMNQPFSNLSDNVHMDIENLNQMSKKLKKLSTLFFDQLFGPFSGVISALFSTSALSIYSFMPNEIHKAYDKKFVCNGGYQFLLIPILPGLVYVYYCLLKFQQIIILNKDLSLLDKEFSNKQTELSLNLKQLKALGKSDYFFQIISDLKIKINEKKIESKNLLEKDWKFKIINKSIPFLLSTSNVLFARLILMNLRSLILEDENVLEIMIKHFGYTDKNAINDFKQFTPEKRSIRILIELMHSMQFVFSVYSIVINMLLITANLEVFLLGLTKLVTKLIKIQGSMDQLTIGLINMNPFVNFKADGTIYLQNAQSPRFERINLSIENNRNEILAILGESGSGKTSLVNSMSANAVIAPRTLFFGGTINGQRAFKAIEDLHPENLKSTILLLKQEGLIVSGSIKDNLLMGDNFSNKELLFLLNLVGLGQLLKEKGIEIYCQRENKILTTELMEQFLNDQSPSLTAQFQELGLNYDVGFLGNRLSGGQKQKLSIARLLLRKPRILILDEPTTGFDPLSAVDFMRNFTLLLKELEKKGQYITVIIVTHDLDLVYNFAYQAIFLRKNYNNKGEIAEMGSPKQLFHQKGTLLEKQYMAFKQNVSEETAAN